SLPPHPLPSAFFPYTTLFRSIPRVFATCDFAGLSTIISPDHSLLNSVLPQLGQTFSLVSVLHLLQAISFISLPLRLDGPGLSLRSEEHTSELQSRFDLVCRLL